MANHKPKKSRLRTVIITAVLTAAVAAPITWLVHSLLTGLWSLAPTIGNDSPYRLTLTAPLTDQQTQRRFQFLLLENTGKSSIEDFQCKISCARTVDADVQVVDFNLTSEVRRTPEAIYLDVGSIPGGAGVVLVIWHKLGAIETGDVAITWQGTMIEPQIKYLR